jgi:hypothetical protein
MTDEPGAYAYMLRCADGAYYALIHLTSALQSI